MTEKKASKRRQTMQDCAKLAWDCVAQVPQKTDPAQYATVARKLPAMLQTNGLGQTLAFLQAKSKDSKGNWTHHHYVYVHLSRWLTKQLDLPKDKDVCHWVLEQRSATYRWATVEAMAYATWLRRFAEAEVWNQKGGK